MTGQKRIDRQRPLEDRDAPSYLLRSEADLLDVAAQAADHARRVGAESVTAIANEQAGTTIRVRDGRPSSSVRDGGHTLSVTVFDGGRSGSASTEAIDSDSIKRAVEQAHAIARQVEPDPEAGLADPAWLACSGGDVPLFAPSGRAPTELATVALAIEAEALEQASRQSATVRVYEAAASSVDMRWARVTSDGFARADSASLQARNCIAIAEAYGAMTRDWWDAMARREDDLPDITMIAREAVTRSVAKLGVKALSTRSAPVLLDARIANSLVFELVGGLTGSAQQQRSTFLLDSIGSQRLAQHIDIVEDPFEPYGLASAAWDSDGVAASRRHIVGAGVIEGYFLNARSARKLGTRSTGNAEGPTNLTLISRNCAPDDDITVMLRKLDRGLWVTQFLGGQANNTTGSYSKAAEGFWVENGEVVHPVHDITIAGDLPTMLKGIAAVGSDQYRQGSVRTGSILLDTMRIAGR